MSGTISWLHVGDLHMDEADGMISHARLERIVAEANTHLGDTVDFVFLPGDNANHATPAQYQAITGALAGLDRPWRIIPGDHDFEGGDLAAYECAIPEANRHEAEVIARHRCICIFLDIISAGAGGPDFRLTMHHRSRLLRELARAEAEGQTPLVFMHAYPGDLAADADEIARVFADTRVAFVDTGHTHYNKLLNDGRVVYGATRSTGQIEEGGGQAGFSIVTVHDTVPSWRFKTFGGEWPFVQIVGPADYRLVTRPADPRQVSRPGSVEITAKIFGRIVEPVLLSAGGSDAVAMARVAGTSLWRASVTLPPGLHKVSVTAGNDRDTTRVLVRAADEVPRRAMPVAPGRDIHTIGAWPEHDIDGLQLGPNKNGMRL